MTAPTDDILVALQERVGHDFGDRKLLEQALVHPSLAPESGGDNQRLEFLGDAVLGLVIGERLMQQLPDLDEGALSRLRAALVSADSLARLAVDLGLDERIRLGKGEEKTGGRAKTSILAACYEAVVGAIFLDGGYEAARRAVARHFGGDLRARARKYTDYKSALQELTQARYGAAPEYRTVDVRGPDHDRRYRIEVVVDGVVRGVAEGASRKKAEQHAARKAIDSIADEAADG